MYDIIKFSYVVAAILYLLAWLLTYLFRINNFTKKLFILATLLQTITLIGTIARNPFYLILLERSIFLLSSTVLISWSVLANRKKINSFLLLLNVISLIWAFLFFNVPLGLYPSDILNFYYFAHFSFGVLTFYLISILVTKLDTEADPNSILKCTYITILLWILKMGFYAVWGASAWGRYWIWDHAQLQQVVILGALFLNLIILLIDKLHSYTKFNYWVLLVILYIFIFPFNFWFIKLAEILLRY